MFIIRLFIFCVISTIIINQVLNLSINRYWV